MILCILINGAMAFAIILVLLYCIGPLDAVLSASYPIIPICPNAMGSMCGSNAMVSSLIIVTYFVVAASVASVSRIMWAWARDGAFPSSLADVGLLLCFLAIRSVRKPDPMLGSMHVDDCTCIDLPKLSRPLARNLVALRDGRGGGVAVVGSSG